jgi:hypothetical protein
MTIDLNKATWQQQMEAFVAFVINAQKDIIHNAIHLMANAFDDYHKKFGIEREKIPEEVFRMTLMLDNTKFEKTVRKSLYYKEEELRMLMQLAQLTGFWIIWEDEHWVPIRVDEFTKKFIYADNVKLFIQ